MSENCSHNCSSCESGCDIKAKQPNIKKVIGVVSGKGGVGKSLVTSLLAVFMARKGFKTAILDADITGPSIPKIFGITQGAVNGEDGIIPPVSAKGTQVMSMNVLLEDETQPVVWRGPIIAGTVKQFFEEVAWDETDFMFVDMPPGTGDVPLTVFQSLPVEGIVVVTTPQDLVGVIVKKAVQMANMMNIPIIGIVENMSYFECPHCGEKHWIFGRSRLEELAAECGVAATARIPINPDVAAACDEGRIEETEFAYLGDIAEKLLI